VGEYNRVLKWLFNQLPMYQRQGSAAYKADITNTVNLCNYLDNPQNKIKTVHVAGTNGKGSTSHMLASVFQEAGYKTGLYTSPHLKDFRERIKIDGEMISENEVVDFVQTHKKFFKKSQLSFFEMTVGMAFDYFAKREVDIAIIEVGMGGRLDSTNVITPKVSVITNIGLDHTQFLGDTLEKVAFEKAGIIKKEVPVVIGQTQSKEITSVFKQVARKNSSEIYFADKLDWLPHYKTDLLGDYQNHNIKTALAAIKILQMQGERISEESILNGLLNVVYNTGLLGRWQQLLDKPKVICDTAHNKEGLEITTAQIAKEKFEKLHLVLGFVSDKEVEKVLDFFPKDAHYYICQPDIPRALSVDKLEEIVKERGLNYTKTYDVRQAYATALENSNKNDFIYIGGSTFVVAEVV
jgi:dihydrofolate synthase/folylpolyglutamate synthase